MRLRGFTLVLVLALGGCRACGGPPALPKGPAPEYEEPHVPSWLDAGAPAAPESAPPPPPPSMAPAPGPDAG